MFCPILGDPGPTAADLGIAIIAHQGPGLRKNGPAATESRILAVSVYAPNQRRV